MIPISLLISLESVKVLQAYLLEKETEDQYFVDSNLEKIS
jgi:hypothetical protein